MKKLRRMLLLAIFVCALTASIVTVTVTPFMQAYAFPSIVARQFLPSGDPIDGPGPPGVSSTPQSP